MYKGINTKTNDRSIEPINGNFEFKYYNSLDVYIAIKDILLDKELSPKKINGLINECKKLINDYNRKGKILSTKNKVILEVVFNIGMLYGEFTYYVVSKYILFIIKDSSKFFTKECGIISNVV